MDQKQHERNSWYEGYNPLLVGLPRFADPAEFIEKLAFDPLAGIDVSKLSFMDRNALLVGEKVPLEPTTQSARAGMTWYGMFDTGLRARNPVNPEARRRYWAALSLAAQGAGRLVPAPTRGIAVQVVKGPTGTGKSVTAQRFCSLLPPVMDRQADDAAGWREMRQLVWLELMLSHDGTRGGFVTRILLHMDEVLGTSYATDLPRKYRTVDKLAEATIGRLIAHYTGILFIDEGQLRNLVLAGQADLMQLFVLMLMNSGIPIVLIGNEMAFDWITYSQDQSRLNVIPPEIFVPVGAIDGPTVEDDWLALSNGIMRYYLLPRPPAEPKKCAAVLRDCSGGIARLGLTIWCACQHEALHAGRECVGPEDIMRAYQAGALGKLQGMVEGFRFRKPELLTLYPDINANYYAQLWGKPSVEESKGPKPADEARNPKDAGSSGAQKPKRQKSSERSKFEKERARNKKNAEKREELSRSLSPEDARQQQGLINVLLAGLEEARKQGGT